MRDPTHSHSSQFRCDGYALLMIPKNGQTTVQCLHDFLWEVGSWLLMINHYEIAIGSSINQKSHFDKMGPDSMNGRPPRTSSGNVEDELGFHLARFLANAYHKFSSGTVMWRMRLAIYIMLLPLFQRGSAQQFRNTRSSRATHLPLKSRLVEQTLQIHSRISKRSSSTTIRRRTM